MNKKIHIGVIICLTMIVVAVNASDASAYFSGTGNNYIKVQSASSSMWEANEKMFTISVWVRTSGTSGTIVHRFQKGGGVSQIMVFINNNVAGFTIQHNEAHPITAIGTTSVNDNAWHYISAARHDFRKIWLSTDASDRQSTTNTATSLSSIQPNSDLFIGVPGEGSNYGLFSGYMDELVLAGTGMFGNALKLNWKVGLPNMAVGFRDIWPLDSSKSQSDVTASVSGPTFSTSTYVPMQQLNTVYSGHALRYIDGSVALCESGALDGKTAFTVEALYKPSDEATEQGQHIIAYKTSELMFNFRYMLQASSDGGYIKVEAEPESLTSRCFEMEDKTAITSGMWHHLATSVDLVAGVIKVYVDGTLVDGPTCSTTFTSGTDPYLTLGNLGLDGTGTATSLRGDLDEVKIWNGARTAEEILAASVVSVERDATGLLAYYTFDDCTSSSTGIKDWSTGDRDCIMNLPGVTGRIAPSVVGSTALIYQSRAANTSIPGALSPTGLAYGTVATITLPSLTMGPMSGLTGIAWAKDGLCNSKSTRVGYQSIPSQTSTITLSQPFSTAGMYSACITVDGGMSFATQSHAKLSVFGADPAIAYVTDLSPETLGVGSVPNITVTGAEIGLTPTTAISFAAAGKCESGPRNGTTLLTESSTTAGSMPNTYIVKLGAPIMEPGTYKVCFSINSNDWIEQQPSITIIAASQTTVSSVSPSYIGAGGPTWITVNGVQDTSTTYVAFAVSGQCNSQNKHGIVGIFTQNHTVLTTVHDDNSYRLCLTVDGTTWYEQTHAGYITVVPPTTAATMSVEQIGAGVAPTLSITGPHVTPTSFIGFSATVGVCNTILAITQYNGGAHTLSSGLWSNGTISYQLCFSTDSGVSWGLPGDATINVIQATNTSISGTNPSLLWTGTTPLFTFTGAKATATTVIALALSGQCATSRVATTQYTSAGAVTLGSAVSVAGQYAVCYSTDGSIFFEQEGVSIQVYASATSTTITDISPKTVAAGTLVDFSATGGANHPSYSQIAFALPGTCSLSQYRTNVTDIPASWPVGVGMPSEPEVYALCHTADGANWVEQDTLRLTVVVASHDSISAIDSVTNPTLITTTTSAEIGGAVATPTTSGFFIDQADGYVCTGTRYGQFSFNSGTSVTFSAIGTPGNYLLCYSVDSITYYAQITPKITLSSDAYLGKVTQVKFGSFKTAKVGLNAQPLVWPTLSGTATFAVGIAFVPIGDSGCASAQGITAFPTTIAGQNLGNQYSGWGSGAGINAVGTYAVCFEDTASGHNPAVIGGYSRQVGINIEVVSANTDSITAMSKTVIGVGTVPAIMFTGAQVTPDTKIAFVIGTNCGTGRVAETLLNDDSLENQLVALGSAINVAGDYRVCYTVGSGWTRQDLAGVTLKVIEAQNDSISAISPEYIAVNTTPSITFTDADASASTKIAIAVLGQCQTARLAVTSYTADGPLQLSAGIVNAGNYSVCYSTDGTVFVEQLDVVLHVVTASTDSISSISVTESGAGTRPTITFTGLIATPSTQVALALPGQCESGPRIGAVSVTSGTSATLSADLPASTVSQNVEYRVCLSMSPWVQQVVGLTVVSAISSSVQSISPPVIGAGSSPWITITGAPALATSRIAFALTGQCGSTRYAETPYTVAAQFKLSTPISSANEYKSCFSVDSGTTWTEQSVGITVAGASAVSITSMTPTKMAALTNPDMTFVTAIVTPTSYVAFSLDSCVTRVGVSPVNGAVVPLVGTIESDGDHSLCYTVNNITWFRQTGVELTVVRSKADSVTSLSPGLIAVKTSPTMTLLADGEAVVTTSLSKFAFALPGKCNDSSARNGTTLFPVSQPVVLGQPFSSPTRMKLCFTAGGNEWVEQVPWINVTQSDPSMVSTFTPTVAGANTAPVVTILGSDGAILKTTPTSKIAFAPTGQCNVPSARQVETSYTSSGAVTLSSKFTTAGSLRLCVSTNDGAWYDEQTGAPVMLVAAAMNNSIVMVSPIAIEKDTQGPLNLTGLVPSPTTWIALAYPGQCQVGRFSTTRVTAAGLVTLSSEVSVAATYSYCYSVDNGASWTEQIEPSLLVQDCLTIKSCALCESTSQCRWCLDSNVCSVSQACTGTLASGTCPTITAIDAGKSGSILGLTPTLISGTLFVNTSLTSNLEYKCGFGSAPSIKYVNATLISSTQVSCVSPSWPNDDTTTLSIWLDDVQYTSNMKSVEYYDCSQFGQSCGGCYTSSRSQCGWCIETGMCQIGRQCVPNLFGASSCPTITSLSPGQTNIADGGTLTVQGTLFIDSPQLFCRFGNATTATTYSSVQKLTCPIPKVSAAGTVEVDLWYMNRPYSNSKSLFFIKPVPPEDILTPIVVAASSVVAVMGAVAILFWRRHKKALTFAPPKLTRAFLDEILFKPPKVGRGALGLAPLLTSLEELLCRPDAAELRFAIAAATQATEMDMSARSFVHLLVPRKRVVNVITEFITHEVWRAQSQTTLFRTNSFATKLFNFYSKVIGVPLLHKALGYVLNEAVMTSGNVEMDSSKRTDGEGDDPMARFQLLLVNQKVLKSIVKAEQYVPSEFRILFHHLQSVIRERFPIRTSELASIIYDRLGEDLDKTREAFSVSKDDHDQLIYLQSEMKQSLDSLKGSLEPVIHHFNMLNGHITDMSSQLKTTTNQVEDLLGALDPKSHGARRLMSEAQEQQNSIAIGGFFFLRFLVPAVTTPESYGILQEPPNPEQRRLLVLVAKVLQNLSNNVEFGRKEAFMTKLNDFVRSNHGEINKLFDKLADTGRETKPLRVPKVRVPNLHHDAAIVSLYQHIQTNLDKITTILEEGVDDGPPDPQRVKLADELVDVLAPIADEAAKFDVGRPLKKGWLTKQGGRIKTWKERFFVLKSNVIQYFKEEKDKAPKGSILLSAVLRVEETKDVRDDDDEYTFAIVTEERTYNIFAESRSDREGWIQAIKDAIVGLQEDRRRMSSRRSTRKATVKDEGEGVGATSAQDIQLEVLQQPAVPELVAEPVPEPIPQPAIPEPITPQAAVPPPLPTKPPTKPQPRPPVIWYRVLDPTSQKYYYVNDATRETTWEHPGDAADVRDG